MFRVLVVTTDNEPGVLDRVASTFRRRGFNLHSLTAGPGLDPERTRMTLVLDLDQDSARRAKAFLERLVSVHRVEDLSEDRAVVRDLVLARVRAAQPDRAALFQLAQVFQAEVVNVTGTDVALSLAASPRRLEAFLEALKPFEILELGRSGAVAMGRGAVAAQRLAEPVEAPAA